MSSEQEKTKLWKSYGILMGIMLGGAVLILGTQAAWNSIRQHMAKSANISPTTSLETTPTNIPRATQEAIQQESPSNSNLSQQDAVNVIKKYLQAKSRIFAPPFDKQLASSITTGEIYNDLAKLGGSIDWLKQNNSYYQYGRQEVIPTGYFTSSASEALIDVRITEDYSFYMNGRLDETEIIEKEYRFSLKAEDGVWKLAERQAKN